MKQIISDSKAYLLARGLPIPAQPIQVLDESIHKNIILSLAAQLQRLAAGNGADVDVDVLSYAYDPDLHNEAQVLEALTRIIHTTIEAAITYGHHDLLKRALQNLTFSNQTYIQNGMVPKDAQGKPMKHSGYLQPDFETLFNDYPGQQVTKL